MMDIWSGEIVKRLEVKNNQPLSEKSRHLIIAIRSLLIIIKHLVFLQLKLQHANTMEEKNNLRWDPNESSVMPLLQNIPSNISKLSRIFTSMLESDDALKYSSCPSEFLFTIST